MPELPEVETIARDGRPCPAPRRIESLHLSRDPAIRGRLVRYPAATRFVRGLRGRTIKSVERRGKYLVMPLDQDGQRLVVHLGMTGHLRVWEPEETPVKHTHFRALLDSGLELRYDDPRQFGRLLLGTQEELVAGRAFPAKLGPEPIHGDLPETEFEKIVKSPRRPIQSAVLDQSLPDGGWKIH